MTQENPNTLVECYSFLEKIEGVEEWLKMPEDKAVLEAHMSLGRRIRNEWGLWSGSKLKTHLEEYGLTHPDDMSSVIFTCFHRYKNNRPINLNEQVENYKKFWNTPEHDRYSTI